MKFLFALILGVLSGAQVMASTHPLTGSSWINRPENSLAFSQMGFQISGIPDYWQFHKNLDSSAPILEIGTPKKMLLSFRSERVSAKTPLETYVRQYLKDYNQYGLEVTGLQSSNQSGNETVTIDLNQKNKLSRSRQKFFHKDNKVIIATCTDDVANFDSTFKACNQILNTFQWR
ncbi:MAG: hypothetical protein K0R29_1043 [Pseudobdellovibrio sp.]|jgi:hypothetical protein|nr:hypothetical protein [Pseudobdellovibrio sp.]